MKSHRNPSSDCFSAEDKTLLNIYISEYNDIFSSILLQPSCEFLENVVKRVELTTSKKFNGFLPTSKSKIENYFCEQIYSKEYKLANSALKSIRKKLENGNEPKEFDGEIIEHCTGETKKNGKYVHCCGDPFYVFKFSSSVLSPGQGQPNSKEIFLVCMKCEMIYKSSLIKLQCGKCDNEFYSKIVTKKGENEENELPFCTWKKYHCNAIINDTMKCPDCHSCLLLDQENNKIICKKCDKITDPKNITWKCALCQKEFVSEVKPYNPLEFKNMKISVKDTLLRKKKAKPEKVTCGCEVEVEKFKFLHKSSCKGELYLGEMNKKRILVCGKCDALSYYDTFVWTCPLCNKKFKVNGGNSSSGMKNHLIKYDSGKKIQKVHENEEGEEVSEKKSSSKHIGTSNKKVRNMIPTPNKAPKTGLKRIESSRSPYMLLKQNLAKQFSGLEIEDSIRNLGNVFAKNDNEKLYDKLFENNAKKINNNANSNANSYSTASSNKNTNDANVAPTTPITSPVEPIEKKEAIANFEVNEYLIKKQIGEGSFGKIYLVESKTKKQFALKKIVGTTMKEIQSLKHEYEILLSLQKCENSMNLVTIHGIQTKQLDQTTYVMYVLMDLASTDWEKEVLSRQKKAQFYSETELAQILYSLTKTFAELQRKNISHRDIKPQNILVFHDENKYKIADFGEAKELMGDMGNTNKQTLRGTELYMSPILFHALRSRVCNLKYIEHNTYKSDVFSFGLCALFAATLCFESLYDIRELTVSSQVRYILDKYLKRRYSSKLVDIYALMLEVNEKSRCDFIELEKVFENSKLI